MPKILQHLKVELSGVCSLIFRATLKVTENATVYLLMFERKKSMPVNDRFNFTQPKRCKKPSDGMIERA